MRMLQPHELYRAQGFPEWYIIDQDYRGKKYAKDKQVARCGNAVPPPFAEALVRANLPELCQSKQIAAWPIIPSITRGDFYVTRRNDSS